MKILPAMPTDGPDKTSLVTYRDELRKGDFVFFKHRYQRRLSMLTSGDYIANPKGFATDWEHGIVMCISSYKDYERFAGFREDYIVEILVGDRVFVFESFEIYLRVMQ